MSRNDIVCAWMREDSKDALNELASKSDRRLCEAFIEGYVRGRADEDTDGYYYSMYQDLRKAGCL